MSLVSNFIGGISSTGLGEAKITPSFDTNDKTFADLLQKQLENKLQPESASPLEGLGIPAGFEIESFNNTEIPEINPIEINNSAGEFDMNKNNDMTTSETVTFFSSLLNNISNPNNSHSEVFDFARKQASNLYNRYSRSVVTDLSEFVEDIHK